MTRSPFDLGSHHNRPRGLPRKSKFETPKFVKNLKIHPANNNNPPDQHQEDCCYIIITLKTTKETER